MFIFIFFIDIITMIYCEKISLNFMKGILMENSEINKLGKKLEIYTSIDYIGKGFPIILPNGAKIIKILRDYVEAEEEKNGFLVVRTPSISKAEIYEIEDRLGLNKNNIFTLK